MSVYCYLSCKQCNERLFTNDSGGDIHADPHEHAQFLEKHWLHPLIYFNENYYDDNSVSFKLTTGHKWHYGELSKEIN